MLTPPCVLLTPIRYAEMGSAPVVGLHRAAFVFRRPMDDASLHAEMELGGLQAREVRLALGVAALHGRVALPLVAALALHVQLRRDALLQELLHLRARGLALAPSWARRTLLAFPAPGAAESGVQTPATRSQRCALQSTQAGKPRWLTPTIKRILFRMFCALDLQNLFKCP